MRGFWKPFTSLIREPKRGVDGYLLASLRGICKLDRYWDFGSDRAKSRFEITIEGGIRGDGKMNLAEVRMDSMRSITKRVA